MLRVLLSRLFSQRSSRNIAPINLETSIVPIDADNVLVVLLGMHEDLLPIVIDHLGEGAWLGLFAGTCRTFRRAAQIKRQQWKQLTLEFHREWRSGNKFCHFVCGDNKNTSAALLVSDSRNGQIYASSSVEPLEVLKAPPCTPYAIASDGTHVYVADQFGKRVIKAARDDAKKLLSAASDCIGAPLDDPFGVAFAPATATSAALCFVSDRAQGRICAFDAATLTPLFAFGNDSESWACLDDPCGICFEKQRLYVADRGNARLVVFDRSGRPLRAIGGPSKPAKNGKHGLNGPGTFLGPCGVLCHLGQLFVIDSMGVRGKVVQVFDAEKESPRLWIRLPTATRLVGIGCTNEALYVCDMVSREESTMYRAPWGESLLLLERERELGV